MQRLLPAGLLIGAGWTGMALGEPKPSDVLPELSTEPISETGYAERNPTEWLQVTSRMESASSDIAETAEQLTSTANEIGEAGRLSRLTQLSGLATHLEHRVIQARMAADQLNQP